MWRHGFTGGVRNHRFPGSSGHVPLVQALTIPIHRYRALGAPGEMSVFALQLVDSADRLRPDPATDPSREGSDTFTCPMTSPEGGRRLGAHPRPFQSTRNKGVSLKWSPQSGALQDTPALADLHLDLVIDRSYATAPRVRTRTYRTKARASGEQGRNASL